MSIDRYIAVCQSFSDFFHNLRKHAAAYVITGVTWAAAILLGIPILMYTKKDGAYPFCKCRLAVSYRLLFFLKVVHFAIIGYTVTYIIQKNEKKGSKIAKHLCR